MKSIDFCRHHNGFPRGNFGNQCVFYIYYLVFKNSLIIHEENTKKNHKRVVSLYVDKDFPSFT